MLKASGGVPGLNRSPPPCAQQHGTWTMPPWNSRTSRTAGGQGSPTRSHGAPECPGPPGEDVAGERVPMAGPLWRASSVRSCAWRVPMAGPPVMRTCLVLDVERPSAPARTFYVPRHRRRVWLSLVRRSGYTELLKRRAPEPVPWSHWVHMRCAYGPLVPASLCL